MGKPVTSLPLGTAVRSSSGFFGALEERQRAGSIRARADRRPRVGFVAFEVVGYVCLRRYALFIHFSVGKWVSFSFDGYSSDGASDCGPPSLTAWPRIHGVHGKLNP